MKYEYSQREREFKHIFLRWRGPFVCIRATTREHTRGSWHVCLSDQCVSASIQNYRPYIFFQLPRGNMNTTLRPHIFCFWLVNGNYILPFFPVICWSYLRTEISVTLSTGNKIHPPLFFFFPVKPLCWYYLPTPLLGQNMTQGHFLSGV